MNSRLLLLFLLILSTMTARAQPPAPVPPQTPTLNPVHPLGMQRGTALELTLTGTNLVDPIGIWTSFPAKVTIPSEANNGKNPASLRVKLEVPADAPLGFHSIRVATKRGMSNPRLFCVDDLPQVLESGKNQDPKAAQSVPVPCVVVGRMDPETTDYFKISVKANQRLSFEVIGRRLGSAFDPQLTLLDASTGKELPGGYSNDAPGLQTDARLSYTFKNAGEVLIALRDVSYRGGGDFHYRLRIGDFPCATTPYPLAIKRGSKMSIGFTGPYLEGVSPVEVQAPVDPVIEALQIAPKSANGMHGWPVMLHLSDLEEQLEKEPNNDPKQANRMVVPGAISGRFEEKGDLDHYVFAAKKGQRLVIEASTSEHLSPTEVYLVLKNDKGAQVAASNPMVGAKIDFTAPADGDYTLAVEHLHSWGGPDEVYRISVTPFQPDFAVTLNFDRWTVTQGGKFSIPIFVTRQGYAGPIEISVLGKGLSGTVTVTTGASKPTKGKAPPNPPAATLVVSADQVPAGPFSFALLGKATINGKVVTRLATARSILAPTLGNLPVLPLPMVSQLGLAVQERPPFALALQFDAPEVQAGKPIQGVVTMTPAPGFVEEVALRFEGLPPGVKPELSAVKSAPTETRTRVTFLIPADAKPAKVNVTVIGTTKLAGRDWTLSSAPATLGIKK